MKIRQIITLTLGLLLFLMGLLGIIQGDYMGGPIPALIGISLAVIGVSRSRIASIIFGHIVIVVGCYLITWGIYLLPFSEPKLAHIFGRPLFWELFAVFGGLCAIFHGFCNCILRRTEDK